MFLSVLCSVDKGQLISFGEVSCRVIRVRGRLHSSNLHEPIGGIFLISFFLLFFYWCLLSHSLWRLWYGWRLRSWHDMQSANVPGTPIRWNRFVQRASWGLRKTDISIGSRAHNGRLRRRSASASSFRNFAYSQQPSFPRPGRVLLC